MKDGKVLLIDDPEQMGVELKAEEQALDMSIPEIKIMLAVYLVTPEVENDRRDWTFFM